MFCVKCGAELLDGAKFCTRCVTPVAEGQIEQSKAEVEEITEVREGREQEPYVVSKEVEHNQTGQKEESKDSKHSLVKTRIKQVSVVLLSVVIIISLGLLFAFLFPGEWDYNQMCELIDEYGQNGVLTIYEIESGEPGPDNLDATYVTVAEKEDAIEVTLVEDGEDVFRQEYTARSVQDKEQKLFPEAIVLYSYDKDFVNFTVTTEEDYFLDIYFLPSIGISALTDEDFQSNRYDWAVKGLYTGEDLAQEVPVVTQPEPEAPQEAEQPSNSQQSTSSDTTREDFIEKIGSSYWISEGGDVLLVGGSEYGLNVQNISDWEYQEVYFNGYIDDYAESGYNDGHFYIAFYTDPDEYGDSYRVMIRDKEGSDGICVFVGDYRFGTDYEPFYPYG